jgi:tRNA U34 5-carboxymethylaminomethyl modifying enzyme MnmG/GidA
MNGTAAKKIALATLAAPALTALAVGLAGVAHAGDPFNSSGGTTSASDTISQLQEQGLRVVINKTGTAPMEQCSVIDVRQDRHQHHGGQQRNEFSTAYVDVYCR